MSPHRHLTSDLDRLWRWIRWLTVLGGALYLAMAFGPSREVLEQVDRTWNDWMVDLYSPAGADVAVLFAAVGSVWVTVPLRILVTAWLAWRRTWARLSIWVLSIVVSELTIGSLKALYARPRPPLSLEVNDTFAFPSGHAIAGAVTAIALVAVLTTPGSRRWHWWGLAVSFAAAMALSRTYLRAHWLTDVAAGTMLGATVGLAAVATVAVLRDRLRDRLRDDGGPQLVRSSRRAATRSTKRRTDSSATR